MLQKELVNLGLTDKEAKVYLAAIQLGASTVQKISQKSDVNRATTYVIIEHLMEMGLMSTYDEGKKTFYVAEKPDRLAEYFKEKDKELKDKLSRLKDILPEMTSLYNDFSDRPRVKYYEGVEGLKTVQKDFSDSLKEKEVIYTFLPYDEFYSVKPLVEKLTRYRKKRTAKGITMKVIYTSSKGKLPEFEKEAKKILQEFKYVDHDKYPFSGGMNIYGDKVFMIDYRGNLGAIIIENKTLADTLRFVFEMIWEKL